MKLIKTREGKAIIMNSTATEKYLERITYEIRTSMNSMLGLVELLWETRLDSAQREYVNMFRLSADRLLTMNTGIAELAATQYRSSSTGSNFDVREVLEQTTGLMSILAAEKGISLTQAVHPSVPSTVCGDRKRLEQVLVSLLRNAIRFTEQGHVIVEVEQQPSLAGEIVLQFVIKDTGIGIADDRLGTLFELSEGADDYRGLGLLVTRRAVESMFGTLWVESKLGHGSSFFFTTTVQPGVLNQQLPAPIPFTSSMKLNPGLRILIAEDSEDNMFLLQAFLRDQDVHIERAENGQIALDKLKSNCYDLVLMDVEMPILDGYETTRQLRTWEQAQSIRAVPVVVLTAHTSTEQVGKSVGAGCTAYLPKPIKKKALIEAINQYAVLPTWPEDVPENSQSQRR
jgi:CheY-like chemotaxis protein